MALCAGRVGVNPRDVDNQGHVKGQDVSIATPTKAGVVKPVAQTAGMIQPVGSDSSGRLYTLPGKSTTVTKLLDSTTPTNGTDFPLSGKISDYDFLYIESLITYTGSGTQILTSLVRSAVCEVGYKLITCNEASGGGFVVKDDETLTGIGATFTATSSLYAVYGIKF